MENRKLNYKIQERKESDYTYKAIHPKYAQVKTSKGITHIMLQNTSPTFSIASTKVPILDQGNIGSCVCNAFSYNISNQTNNGISISRLFLYAICRCLDGTALTQDDGTTIPTACAAIKNYGGTNESFWPYNNPNSLLLPSLPPWQQTKKFSKFTYVFLSQNVNSIKTCLQTFKVPIIFGIMLYSSFMSNNVTTTGIVPMPNTKKEKLEGGHCMNIVGFNENTQQFLCANSWGTNWGSKGYCFIPYAYIVNTALAGDLCFPIFKL